MANKTKYKHNNEYLQDFENECWFYYSHILEPIIRGEDIDKIKERYDPDRVDFFYEWRLENKSEPKTTREDKILPIISYGNSILRQECEDIEEYPDLKNLINDMFETVRNANGVGLAAPQIGKPIRLFVVNGELTEDIKDFKQVFINPIIKESGDETSLEEGCLSIPGIQEMVDRKEEIEIEYYDENFELKHESYDGMKARIIQHEYDHIEGILFIDKLSPLRKRLLKKKLTNIIKGKVKTNYKLTT